jgi:hypothetical protein
MQPCRIVYYSLTALHVSSDIFAHHQEHLNCNYSFWFYSRVSLSAAVMAKAYVCGRSPFEIMGSNPTEGMDVCLFWVSCVIR